MAKVVWITGCASGVGLHLTKAFYKRGYRVVATDVNFDGLTRCAEEHQWASDRVLCRRLDVVSPDDWQTILADVVSIWGKVDYLFNVAGYLKPGFGHQTPIEEIDRHIDINLKGLMYGAQLVAKQMVNQQSGHIINISSMAGLAAIPGLSLYSASKFAVRAFSLAMAEELQAHGVKVTVICPDAIQTPMLTLQEDYEEAAMTFSGPKTLTVEDLERVVFNRVLKKAPVEVMLPIGRGILAKLGNVFPGLTRPLIRHLKQKGQKVQRQRKA